MTVNLKSISLFPYIVIIFAQVKKLFVHILLWSIALSLSSCYEDETCNQNTETGVNIVVENSGDDSGTDLDGLDQSKTVEWNLTPLADTVVFVSSENQANSIGIPLDLNDTTIAIVLNIKDSEMSDYLKDTVVFNYVQTDLRLLSVNCGFAPIFNITDIMFTGNVLDSVILYTEVEVSNDLELDNVAFYY